MRLGRKMESGKRRELWSVFSFWMVIFWLWWKIGGPEWVDWTARGLAVGFLVGQVMKRSQGKANPGVVGELIRKKLS